MVPLVFLKEGSEKSQLPGSPGPGEASRHASDPDADTEMREVMREVEVMLPAWKGPGCLT